MSKKRYNSEITHVGGMVYPVGASIPYSDYQKLEEENERLKEQLATVTSENKDLHSKQS